MSSLDTVRPGSNKIVLGATAHNMLPMELSIDQFNAFDQLPEKHRKLLRHWDGLPTLHPDQIKSLSSMYIDEIRDMFGIVQAQVRLSNHTFGKLIVRGNSSNNTVKDYIIMDDHGVLIAKKSCYIIFPECESNALSLYPKAYPQRIFFAGPGSEILVDRGVFRMITPIEIYESPEFSNMYIYLEDAVELID